MTAAPTDSTSTTSEMSCLLEARDHVRSRTSFTPKVTLFLGSGLGSIIEGMETEAEFPSAEIPHFPRCTVQGHDGRLLLGRLGGVDCAVQSGRFHLYEGHPARVCVRPLRLSRLLGSEILLVTNAAGGIHQDLNPGTLMLLTDHLNLTGQNPLTGENVDELGPRFSDMTQAYDLRLQEIARNQAKNQSVVLREGIYAALPGPCYETPAEVRMIQTLGADAVGMSTVPEAIAAVHCGMRVLGLSCITNRAAGLSSGTLSHEEVVEVTRKATETIRNLMLGILGDLAESTS